MTTAEQIYLSASKSHDWRAVTIVAKFNGTCCDCGKVFKAGDTVSCDPTWTPLGWAHAACNNARNAEAVSGE